MKLTYTYQKGAFAQAIADIKQPIAKAATGAMKDTAELAKKRGRASIAAAGFSSRWQNALRADVYPTGKASMSPAAVIRHKIDYAGIFEEGGTISGNPLLWIPIEANMPVRSGGRRWTPKTFAASVGPLVKVTLPGRRPMLFAKGKRGPPLFVGVSQVTISRKFAISEAVHEAAEQFVTFYDRHISELAK